MTDAERPPFDEIQSSEPTGRGRLLPFLIVLALIVAGLFVVGLLPRIERRSELKKAHAETVDAVPVVQVVTARPASQTESIVLPGNIDAIQYVTIYARVDGYLKSRLVDIGDKVKSGQLLALIDTPTIDAELLQAKADLAKAQAALQTAQAKLKEAQAQLATAQAEVEKARSNEIYGAVTAQRYIDLCLKGAVSQQNRDEKIRLRDSTAADLKAAQANEKAAEAQVKASEADVKEEVANVKAKLADVQRLAAKQAFQKVTAPFDGIITLRKVDPGALITQGSQSTNLELYQMAKIDRLRIYVSVPQRIARYLRAGQLADVVVPEFPDRKFTGKVTNVSGALDPNTRTRQTEIQIDNPDQALLPGMYAEVKLTSLREAPWIRVPGTTIVTKPEGLYVVVVNDGKVHYQPITIGRDFGDEVEIRVGLQGTEQVIVSPNDDLREGEPVKIGASLSG